MTSTDFSSAKLEYQTYHDVVVGPHIPVPKHGKPWTSKMVMFTANASHESASINTVSPQKVCYLFTLWKIFKHLQLNMIPQVFETPYEITSKKKPWHSPGKSWWEPSPHREYRIAPYLPKHPSRLRLLKISWFLFWKSSTNWKLLKLCSDSSSPSINIYVHSEITPCQKNHGKVSKCPPILLQASCTSPTSNSWWTAAYDAPGVGSVHHPSPPVSFSVGWSSSWAKAHPGTCTHESRHQSTATCVFLARNGHTLFGDRPKKYAKKRKYVVPLTI